MISWKATAVAATLTLATLSDSAQAQFRNFHGRQRGRVVIPSVQIGQNGPIVRPGVSLGGGVTILPQIRPQPYVRPRTVVIPQPVPVYPTFPTYPTLPVYPAQGLGFLSNNDLEDRVEFRIKAQFGRVVDDVDVDADIRRGRVEVEVELEDFRFARTVQAFVLSMPELRGLRVKLDLDD